MKYGREWEHVNSDTRRLRIPGGWYVSVCTKILVGTNEVYAAISTSVIADPDHEWELEAQ